MITTRSVLTELGVLSVFLIGIFVSRRLNRRWHPTEIAVMYALGLLFEILTCHMWQYHHVFLVFPFHIAKDISALFPLGWAGLIMTATPITEHLWKAARARTWLVRHLILMGVWIVVGDLSEITFHAAGMFEYIHNESTEVIFLLGKLPHLPPTMVLIGYGLLHPFVSHFFRWMESGLRGPRHR